LDRLRKRLKRETYIRAYMFPQGVFEKFHKARPMLDVKQQQIVARGLRQFFLTYHKSGHQRVAMPSQAVDDLWHEFILFTRDYKKFCDEAFGQFLHHTPAVKLGGARVDNEGLRRVWWFACLEENISPRKATRLPLLFAIDRKLGIGDGFVYSLDCRRAPAEVAQGSAGSQCAEAFGDSSVDGSTDGLGCSSGHGGESGADGDGGGGGCGGD
ncbi:MAG: hypothetical protein M3O07_03925, partial [Pseudomonadota bacterium]|nr:hypothetical protein [Pseudomonadota bacterium]